MAPHGINTKIARTILWSITMATATYGIGVIYDIHKVAIRIAKDSARLKAITIECDSIRSADIPLICAMLDQRTERHFIRLPIQNNAISSRQSRWNGR
jgi:hypothetical protein